MKLETGEIKEFANQEEAQKAGFKVPLTKEMFEELRTMSPEDRRARVVELIRSGSIPELADIAKQMSPEDLETLARQTREVNEATATLHKGRPVGPSTVLSTMATIGAMEQSMKLRDAQRSSAPFMSPHKGSKKSTPASRAKRAKRKAQKASRRRNR